jgi:hypothetical protein
MITLNGVKISEDGIPIGDSIIQYNNGKKVHLNELGYSFYRKLAGGRRRRKSGSSRRKRRSMRSKRTRRHRRSRR